MRQSRSLGTVVASGHGYILVLLWGSGLDGVTSVANLPQECGKLLSKGPELANVTLVTP